MDDELTPEQRFAAETGEAMVPRALIQGRRRDDIIADLVRLDWSPQQPKRSSLVQKRIYVCSGAPPKAVSL